MSQENLSETLQLAFDLISRRSVTPEDAGCQELMISRLEPLGFKVERLRFGEVDNIWLRRGDKAPVIAFAGHTDVVPTGPEANWDSLPFTPEIKDGMLLGRGAADMKGSLAAMVTACEHFITRCSDHQGSIAFLITSDEEGPAKNGTVKVMEHLENRNEKIDWCLVGEPSSTEKPGDIIKNGRRGSFHADICIQGHQGHVAYPHLAENPVHIAAPALTDLSREIWDNGNAFFPPTSFQITDIRTGSEIGAENMIPGALNMHINFRYSTEVTANELKKRTEAILDRYGLDYTAEWRISGEPFLTAEGALVAAAKDAVLQVTGYEAELSTSGGTSDGRFIAPTGAQVVELGPVNATIHKVNECVRAADLDILSRIYEQILENLLYEPA